MNDFNLVNQNSLRYFIDWVYGPNNGSGTGNKKMTAENSAE